MSDSIFLCGSLESSGGRSPKFTSVFYTGGALSLPDFSYPVIVDLAGLEVGNVLVANLDHDRSKRVGTFTVQNDGRKLVATGRASAATPARDEVVNSARDGYVWQSSIEALPLKMERISEGQIVNVNGQRFTGPKLVARRSILKGFAFVSHGADDNTSVAIAASAANRNRHREQNDNSFKALAAGFCWIPRD